MEKVLRGYVFRLYPTTSQRTLIEKSFTASRYIYNYFLEKSQEKKSINRSEYIKELPNILKENEWLKEVDGCLIRCSIFNLEDNYKRVSKGLNKPLRFKSKLTRKQSYRTNNIVSGYKANKTNSINIDLTKKVIILPKLKEVTIKGYRNLKEINGRIIFANVYREADKYYVSLCVEEQLVIPTVLPTKAVGIDVGIKDLLTTSDGLTIQNRKIIEKYEKRIAGLNKWLSRTKVGSKNRYKVKKKLQKVYQELKNARKYFLHNISNTLTEENDIIVTETLKIQKLTQGKPLSKYIYDASWYELMRQLEYKSKWKGKKFYQVSAYYPSSKICNHCGYQERKVKDLKIRVWECPNCFNMNERDVNASINILWEGVKKYINELQNN